MIGVCNMVVVVVVMVVVVVEMFTKTKKLGKLLF
jgi:hypothetical protein